jgi:S-adenosylmethionine hydrolase
MITLASDFGTPYPASMKGVILSRCSARLVDIGHDFPRQDVRAAAFWLAETLPEFPPAVHLVVVDPGVGTDRSALVVRAGDHLLVGPDNGVLLPPARELARPGECDDLGGCDTDLETYELAIENPRSSTFHGRDDFAPAAATVHEADIEHLSGLDGLSATDEIVDLRFPDPTLDEKRAVGEILVVDDFGNVVTNVPGDTLDDHETVVVDGESTPVVRSYAHTDVGQRCVTVGSHGNVELAVNRGRGDEAFGLEAGDRVELTFQ